MVPNGDDVASYAIGINRVTNLFPVGADLSIRVEVLGDSYAAFLNDITTPVTTFSTDLFGSGRMALYSNSSQRFDNVVTSVIPIPAALPLMGTGLAVLGFLGWRRRKTA